MCLPVYAQMNTALWIKSHAYVNVYTGVMLSSWP
jgi:hypothetical protein